MKLLQEVAERWNIEYKEYEDEKYYKIKLTFPISKAKLEVSMLKPYDENSIYEKLYKDLLENVIQEGLLSLDCLANKNSYEILKSR